MAGEGLGALFEPRSVAVVGVSRNPSSLGRRALRHLVGHGYAGTVHVVHPLVEGEIEGVPTVPSIAAIDPVPDLAFVCAGGDAVFAILEEAVAAGVPAVAAIAASGAIVDERERVRELLRGSGTRLLGPNMPGFLSVVPPVAPHISNFVSREKLLPAPIGLVTHSGAVGGVLGELLNEAGVGVDWLISTGNEFDVEIGECIEFLAARDLRAIGLFVEAVRDVDSFRRGLERAAERGVPVLATKVGRSAAGERQALTHTGALTGDSALFERELARHGGVLCDDLEELAACLAIATLPPATRRSTAVAAASGGLAGLIGDLVMARGVPVPDLGELANPWDTDVQIVDDPEAAIAYWRRIITREEIGSGVMGFGSFPEAHLLAIADQLATEPATKPLVLCPAAGMPASVIGRLHGQAISVASPRVAAAALQWWTGRAEPIDTTPAPPAATSPSTPPPLDEAEAKRRLSASGVRVPAGGEARGAEEAAALAVPDAPVVLKCLRPALLHKAAAGGVALDLRGGEEVGRAYAEMARAVAAATGEPLEAVLVEEQVPAGLELIASVATDPDYGDYIVVGAGGGEVEVAADVVQVLLPAGRPAIAAAFAELRLAGALRAAAAARGEDGPVPEALLELVEAIIAAAAANQASVEVNPVILPFAAGAPVAADCVMIPAERGGDGT